MSRLVVDRLWPMLLGLAALLAGALALQQWAGRRGNETIRIAIHDESGAGEEDEDAAAGGDEAGADGTALSDLHERARVAARRAQFKEAVALYREALAQQPRSPLLEGELGYVLLLAREPKQALAHLERADRARPSARTAARLGRARERLGDHAGAERDLRRALALRPSHRGARISLGNLLRRRGAAAEAVAILEPAVGTGSNEERARALVALGAAYLASDRRSDAERVFERAVQFAPARVEVRLAVARAWLGTEDRDDVPRALQIAQRTVELAPDVPAVYGVLGRARERAGDPALALEAYDHALRLDPGYRYARRRLVYLALRGRDFPRARHEADRLLADAPGVPEHRYLAALVADREGRRADARKGYLDAIAAARGEYPDALVALAALESAAGDEARARAALEKAVALRPDHEAAWTALGKLHEEAGRRAAAEAAYRKALAIDPRHAAAWLALGQLHADGGALDEAVAELRNAIAARPAHVAAELALARVYTRAGRPDDAVGAYRALLADSPRQATAWHELALVLAARGRTGDAREALLSALAVDPGHVEALRALAGLELRERRLLEARRRFEELLDLRPGDVGARAALVEVSAAEGDHQACEAGERKLRSEAPADERVKRLGALCGALAAHGSRTTKGGGR